MTTLNGSATSSRENPVHAAEAGTPGATRTWASSVFHGISSFSSLVCALLVASVYWTCRDRIADPDLWWHLRNAQYLLTNLRLPNVDMYSFTTAGAMWMNHEWASELPYYAAYRAFGMQGVFVVFAAVLMVIIAAVFWMCMKESGDPLAAAGATIIGLLLSLVGFGPRTQHFGWLCFTVMFAILLRFRSTRQAPLWLLPFIFCLWINCHGTWIFGIATYAIVLGAGFVHRPIGHLVADPWSFGDARKLAYTGIASIAALFVNPFGYRLVLFPLSAAYGSFTAGASPFPQIQEFAGVNFQDTRGKVVLLVLGLIFVLTLIGRARWRIDDALLTVFVVYCGLTHVRLLLLAGIVLPPILAPKFGRLTSYDGKNERRVLNSVLLAAVLCVMLIGFPSSERLQRQINLEFPVRAVEYLRAHPQPGHMFNLYDWGGYLDWALPDVPTFIDGRGDLTDARGKRVDCWSDYSDIIGLKEFDSAVKRRGIGYIVYPPGTPLTNFLSRMPDWELIYSDDQAAILRHATGSR